MYSIDRLLVGLVDRGPLRAVTVVPPQGGELTSSDEVRVRSFFPALWDYGMCLELCERTEVYYAVLVWYIYMFYRTPGTL